MSWYRHKKIDMTEHEYRDCAFFQNREYKNKPGYLTLLYEVYLRCIHELPTVTRENAFDLLRFQFKVYAKTLENGNFNMVSEKIGDESVFLQINEFKNGIIQYTNSTNVMRLVK
jgi:hypothetical protein